VQNESAEESTAELASSKKMKNRKRFDTMKIETDTFTGLSGRGGIALERQNLGTRLNETGGQKQFQVRAYEPQSYSKLVGVRSRPYRNRFLQMVFQHYFFKIYKMCTLL